MATQQPKSILIGTSNPGKVNEIKAVLNGLNLQLVTPKELEIFDDIAETGLTYQENAHLKAMFYSQKAPHLAILAEDSGIVVDALKDQLGVHTRRWGAGETATDLEWITYFMQEMSKFSDPTTRTARFVSHMCLQIDGQTHYFSGETQGQITFEIEADLYPGLPLSSVFKPTGFSQVYSALIEDQKNQISHRGKAIAQVKNFLINHYGL